MSCVICKLAVHLMYSVLYVDDEAILLELCTLYLERTGDFRIDTSTSAKEALEKIQQSSYDAIVSDYQMPGMDGIALLKKVRSAWGDIPFILFTGKGREEVVIEAINNGADFYLQKGGEPTAQFAELAHKIKRAVEIKAARQEVLEIVQGSPIPKFVIDRDHRVIFWNRALEEYSGITAHAVVGTTDHWKAFYDRQRPCLADLIVDANIDGISRWYGGKQEKSSVIPGAYEATDFFPGIKGGTWLFFTAAPLRDPLGHIIGAIETLQDVTSLRKKEEELRTAYDRTQAAFRQVHESEQRYHTIVETQTELICRFRPDGTHIFTNEAYCRYFNRPCREITGHRFRPDIPRDDQERVRQHFSSLTRENPVGVIEHRIIMPDGEIRWQQWNDRAIFDRQGMLTEFQSVGRDVTKRKRAEEKLAAEHEVSQRLASASTLDDALPFCLSTVISLSGMDSGGIYLISPRTGNLDLICHSGLSEAFIRETSSLAADSDKGRLVYAGRPVYSRFTDIGIDLSSVQVREGLRAIAILPIVHRDHIIGCFNIASHTKDSVPEDSRRILEALATQVGNGIARIRAEEATRMSEERFRDLANLLPQTIYEIDTSGRITFANRFAFEAFGYSPSELDAGLYVMQMIHPDDRERARMNMKKMLDSGKVSGIEYRALRKDGTTFPVIIYGSRILQDNRVAGLRGVIADISEQKKAEYAIRQREEQLINFMQNLPVGIFRTTPGPAGRRIMANPILAAMHGFDSFDEFMACPVADHYADPQERKRVSDRLLQEGRLSNVEIHLRKKDGALFWANLSAIAVPGPNGEIEYFDGVLEDITERRRAADILRESEDRYRKLVEITPDTILVHQAGRIVYMNPAGLELLGAAHADQVIGKPVLDFVHTDSRDMVRTNIEKDLKGEGTPSVEIRMVRLDGGTVTVEGRGVLTIYEGKPAIQVAIRDITKLRHA